MRNTPQPVPRSSPPTDPQIARGAVGGEQLPLLLTDGWEARTPGQRAIELHALLAQAVEAHEGGPVAFAAKMERSIADVSRRLRRAEDSKGETQRAPLDYLGFLDREARQAFLAGLCARWGFVPPRPLVQLSAADKLRIVAAELPERRRRALEREHQLPAGSLDP